MKLIRVASTAEATYGVLIYGKTPFALTLERPWLDNKKGESCIPKGTYQCRRVNSPKFGNTFEITGVPGRDAILFHKGNLSDDSHGCILVGEQFAQISGRPGIAASKEGFAEFMEVNASNEMFTLEIEEAY